jgi:hypothetical protein
MLAWTSLAVGSVAAVAERVPARAMRAVLARIRFIFGPFFLFHIKFILKKGKKSKLSGKP